MAEGLQTDMLIQDHSKDPARNAFSGAVSPAMSPMRGSVDYVYDDQRAYYTNVPRTTKQRASTQIQPNETGPRSDSLLE